MKTNIKIVFKDNTEWVFDANGFDFEEDGFCRLDFVDEEDRGSLVGYVSMSEIKYLRFVEAKE